MIMKRKCAWCGRSLGLLETESTAHSDNEMPTTHTICPECLEKTLAEIQQFRTKSNQSNE